MEDTGGTEGLSLGSIQCYGCNGNMAGLGVTGLNWGCSGGVSVSPTPRFGGQGEEEDFTNTSIGQVY